MLTEEQFRKLPQPAQAFWRKAWAHVTKLGKDWDLIEKNTAQMAAWRRYFEGQGWEPFAIRQIRLGKLEKIVMPDEWPHWFDKSAEVESQEETVPF